MLNRHIRRGALYIALLATPISLMQMADKSGGMPMKGTYHPPAAHATSTTIYLIPPITATSMPHRLQEDEPGWDCHTMGNRTCGEDLPATD